MRQRQTAIERYHEDPEFHTLVDSLEYFIADGKFTVGELKQALTIAAVKFEMYRVRPTVMLPASERERLIQLGVRP